MNRSDIVNFIKNLDQKDFYKYFGIAALLFFVLIGGIWFFQFRRISSLEERLRRINKDRVAAQFILKNQALVKQQRGLVEALLEKDPDFIIKEFFESIVNGLGLVNKSKGEFRSSEMDLKNGYVENLLESNFENLDMKEIVQLLYKVDQKERVYIEKIDISRMSRSSKLSLNLVIATLQPKVQL